VNVILTFYFNVIPN